MKIRKGFVSNSSSESFICGRWNDKEYTPEEATAILQKMLDFYNDMEEQSVSFDNVFEVPRIATEEDIDLLSGWDIPRNRVEGQLLINSIDDNSIPYLLFGFIETKFGAERIHLG
jgi:hypothetical protein